jgi:hypothetical protein
MRLLAQGWWGLLCTVERRGPGVPVSSSIEAPRLYLGVSGECEKERRRQAEVEVPTQALLLFH